MLDQRANGYNEEARKESEKREQHRGGLQRVTFAVEQATENRHANGAERDEADFNLSAEKIPGGYAAKSDADGERSLDVAGLRVVHLQNVVGVNDDHELDERGEEK